MKKFNNKKTPKKQEPEEEVEDSGDEDVELDASEDEDDDLEDGEEEDEEDDDNLLDNEAEEDDGEEDDGEEEDGDEEDDDEDDDDEEDDDDDDEDEDDNPLAPRKIPFDTPKVEAKHDLVAKFLDINGKRLYVRFPKKLPESKEELLKQLKSYCPLVKEVIKPRQKHANHCMVDFATKEDREKGLKKLSTVQVEGKALIVKPPTMEDKTKVESAIEKKEKKKQEKKMKHKLRKLAKKKAALTTSTLFITNIPPTATVADLKEHFPNAVDIKVKHNKDSQDTAKASVTLPTPEDATKARKLKITIQENLLHIKFDVSLNKQGWRTKQNKKFKQSTKKEGAAPKPGQKRNFKKGSPTKGEPVDKKIKTESPEEKVKAEPSAKVKIEKKKGKKPKINKKPVGVSV